MCLGTSFGVLVYKTNLEFPLSCNQLFYMSLEWSLNLRNFKNLFRLPLSVTFIKDIFFFVILTLSPIENFGAKVLPPNSGYKFLHTIYFSFPYDLLPSESFLSMHESYYCTDSQVCQVHQQIFLYYLQRNT